MIIVIVMAVCKKVVVISIVCALSLAIDSKLIIKKDTQYYDSKRSRLLKSHSTCPSWQMPSEDNNSSSCKCGPSLSGIVKCDETYNGVYLLPCYCMSESELLNKTIVGNCLYTCGWLYRTALTNDPVGLDNQTCKPLKRTGQLCGDCISGHAPPIYSYNLECVDCSTYATNWLKYIAVAFFPLTVFYVIVVVFRISVTTPKLRCLILIFQILVMPGHLRYLYTLQKTYIQSYKTASKLAETVLTVFTLWNLDFFRAVYDPFCLHPRVHSLGVLALDYLTAIYPLFLIFITFFCIKFYNNFFLVRWLLKPIHKCCFLVRKEWNIHRSLTDAFATFLCLSYVKILNISFDLLNPTIIYDMKRKKNHAFLYYSGTVRMFKGEHIPFAILAIFMMIIFNITPLILLCLYPLRCFQRLLNSCKFHFQTLHVFMDIFNGCYRTKPIDYRYFSVVYLIIRILNLMIFSLTLTRLYYPSSAILGLLTAILVAMAQPYKNAFYNKLDTFLLLLFTLTYIAATAYALPPPNTKDRTFIAITILMCVVYSSYLSSLVIYWAIPHRVKQKIKKSIKHIYSKVYYIQPINNSMSEADFLETADNRELSSETSYHTFQN